MRYKYFRFTSYEDFEQGINIVRAANWILHSWQDVGGNDGIDIRSLFTQDMKFPPQPFPLKAE